MIELGPSQSIWGNADAANAITYTITGQQILQGNPAYQVLAQGQLSSAPAPLYAVPHIDGALVSHILLANTTGLAHPITMFVNGSTAANQIISLSIPANGSATLDAASGWTVKDGTGALIGGGQTGPQGPQGPAGSGTSALGWFIVSAFTSTAIQAQVTLAAAAGGGIVYCPPGVYSITATVQLADRVTIMGGAPTRVNASQPTAVTVLRMAAGANLDAVVAENNWYASNGNIGVNQGIMNLCIDGNQLNQASGQGFGFASSGWRTTAIDCDIINCKGAGILLTSLQRNGSTNTGTHTIVECRFIRCNIDACNGHGIYIRDPQNEITDGFIEDCLISSIGATASNTWPVTGIFDGIHLDQGGGWTIHHCHIYGTGRHGIYVLNASDCRVHDNYVEYFGGATGATPCGGLYIAGSWSCALHDNNVNYNGGNGTTTYGIYGDNSNGQTPGSFFIRDNALWTHAATGTAAIRLVNVSGAFNVSGRTSNIPQVDAGGTWSSNYSFSGTITDVDT